MSVTEIPIGTVCEIVGVDYWVGRYTIIASPLVPAMESGRPDGTKAVVVEESYAVSGKCLPDCSLLEARYLRPIAYPVKRERHF